MDNNKNFTPPSGLRQRLARWTISTAGFWLILYSLAPTVSGQLIIQTLPPQLQDKVQVVNRCPSPSFDPGEELPGLEEIVRITNRTSLDLDMCIGTSSRVVTSLVNSCIGGNDKLRGWTFIQVVTVTPCHSATIVSSPRNRYYYVDNYFNPFFSCVADIVEMQEAFDSTPQRRKWVPLPGSEAAKLNKLRDICAFFAFSGENALQFQEDLGFNSTNFQCGGSASPPQPTGRPMTCRLPDRRVSIPIRTVTSYDPNDKLGSRGNGTPQFTSGEEPLRYSIFFENVETATAPAQEVVITDQLDTSKIDVDSFSLGPISFGNKQIIPPPGLTEYTTTVDLRPAEQLLVNLEGRLNKTTGLLTWRFRSVDPVTGEFPDDPLVGFLPANKVPPEGDGNVLFTVMPKKGLSTGTEIRNQARIIFDTNAPIDTPQWLNTLDNTKPTSNVLPLAATQNSPSFDVQWQGTDVGSGVKNYTILVSENGGPFTPWLSNTPATSGTFTGQSGKTYGFYSVAQDQTGNREDPPNAADATTQVVADADLVITKTASPNPILTGTNITYTINVTNNGPGAADKVTVTDNLPASTTFVSCSSTGGGVCGGSGNNRTITFTSLAAGASATITFVANVSCSLANGATISNTATVSSPTPDPATNNNSATANVTASNPPPVITNISANPSVLWPPDHRMVDVIVNYNVTDNCESTTCALSVSSNEPIDGTGDGDTAPDWEIVDAYRVRLRAERAGAGAGRIYTITVTCRDGAGASSSKSVTVRVPISQGQN